MADFNYQRDHARAFFNPQGKVYWCHSKDDELRARQDGYTTPNYVRSKFPVTVWKQDGTSKPVGKLDLSDEQNRALVDQAIAEGWSREYAPTVEPAKALASGSAGGEFGLASMKMLVEIAAEMQALNARVAASEADHDKVLQHNAQLTSRVAELERTIDEAAAHDTAKVPQQHDPQKSKASKPAPKSLVEVEG